jgi:hypothetical protein
LLSGSNPVGSSGQGSQLVINIRTNTSAQIRIVAAGSATTVNIATHGWIDTRGRFN